MSHILLTDTNIHQCTRLLLKVHGITSLWHEIYVMDTYARPHKIILFDRLMAVSHDHGHVKQVHNTTKWKSFSPERPINPENLTNFSNTTVRGILSIFDLIYFTNSLEKHYI